MRHAFIVIDMGDAMLDKDLVPTRQTVTVDVSRVLVETIPFQLLTTFIDEYFDQNPISLLGLIITKDKRAQMLLELTGNVRKHLDTLEALREVPCEGEPSVQNALKLAISRLKWATVSLSHPTLQLQRCAVTQQPRTARDHGGCEHVRPRRHSADGRRVRARQDSLQRDRARRADARAETLGTRHRRHVHRGIGRATLQGPALRVHTAAAGQSELLCRL